MTRVYIRKQQTDRPIKMARYVEIEQSKEIQKNNAEVMKSFNKDNTKIVTKEYILNDVTAIEKKWNLRNVDPIKV